MRPDPTVFVRHGRVKPLLYRHPWLFAGSIERVEGEPSEGDVVDVRAPDGRFLARGFFSPRSALRVRLFAFEPSIEPDEAWLRSRIDAAAAYRREVLGLPGEASDAFRIVHAEADGLPGLVADCYAGTVVLQASAAWIERRKEALLKALDAALAPRAILQADDPEFRAREGLEPCQGWLRGAPPPDGRVVIREHGASFEVVLGASQKTGFYLDQRENRRLAASLARGRYVLDGFTYTGAFAVACARAGAEHVLGVDSSGPALEVARSNAARNAVGERVEFIEADAYRLLGEARRQGRTFGLVILDPPKYAASRATVPQALQKLKELVALGIRVTSPGGILVACSCSGLVDSGAFDTVLREAAMETRRTLRVFHRGGQAPDHPYSIACPESRYLQAVFCHVP